MSLGQVIRARREELDLTQDQVSNQVDISKPYLSNIETGVVKNPPSPPVLERLEQALQFKPGELQTMADEINTPQSVRAELERMRAIVEKLQAGGKAKGGKGKSKSVELLSPGRMVPIINKVAAGYPHHFTDLDYPVGVADDYIRCPDVHDGQAFAARVVGDSMQPRYNEGDVVIFAPNTTARSGDECFVRFATGETTFKRFLKAKGERIRLEPLNDKYPSQEYERDQITGLWPAVMRVERIR